jgi:pseudaminic acid cytidylyltransferase
MKICIIPARGGSKRIPKKNIKFFLGKPIIAYSIKVALESNCFDEVIVSTDDPEISEVAKYFGAKVPFIRPTLLADDYADTISVVKHAIEWFDDKNQLISEVCCLYATAPFVTKESILKSYDQMQKTQAEYCFTVTSFAFPIQRAIKITSKKRLEMVNLEYLKTRSQDLEDFYHDAGQFYWGRAKTFRQQKPIFSKNATPYILPRHFVLDIDTLEDWKFAELKYQILKKRGEIN